MKQLNAFKQNFDKELFVYLDKKEKLMNKLDSKGGEMVKSIREFITYGGKRFRPALFYYTYESFAEKKEINSMRFSYIFELFHTFALIHDDIIDHSELRRGYPTIHTKYGLHMGVLAGDFALTLVDELYLEQLSQAKISESQKQTVNMLFNKYKQDLLVGQYLDCIHSHDRQKIMKLKTADYSFVKPVLLGMSLAGGSPIEIQKWQLFLTKLGKVFQAKDDYLGVFADEKVTGKSSLSDTQEGKNTEIVELFKMRTSKEEKERFNSFFGKVHIPGKDFDWYRNNLIEKGIKQDIIGRIQKECFIFQNDLKDLSPAQTKLVILLTEIISHINQF
jgi:geranylgeranyl diphosphate synthase type I